MTRLLFGVIVLSAVCSVGARAQADYVYTTLYVPGSTYADALGINNNGQIVGVFRTGSPAGPFHGFLLSAGSYTQLDVPGTLSGTIASGISGSGQIVGSYNQGLNGIGSGSAFLLSGGTYTTLPVPSFGALGITANAINDMGQIVGTYSALDAPRGQPPFLVQGGYLLSRGSYTVLTGIYNGWANGINNAGQIVLSNGLQSGVLSAGTITPVSVPGSPTTYAFGINNLGQVAGSYTDQASGLGPRHGFVYRDGTYTTFDIPGATETLASGINDFGQVVGYYVDGTGDHAFLASPTPEPATSVLLAVGALGIIAYGWGRRRVFSSVSV